MLDNELDNRQVLVWIAFREDARQIGMELDRRRISWRKVIGGQSEAETNNAIADFKAGNARVLIAHPASCGHGITLTNCSHAVYYSCDYSAENHLQSRDRIHRIGQDSKCSYYYLTARDTIDEQVLKVLRGKMSAADAAREALR